MKSTSKKGVGMFSNYIKYVAILGMSGFVLSGCGGVQPSVKRVTEEEIGKYEKAYMDEYDSIKKQNANYQPIVRWVQPNNKKEECKVYIEVEQNNDKTQKSSFELFWDGNCKNGYATGLGRKIENSSVSNVEEIAYFEYGRADGYCAITDKNKLIEGECYQNLKTPYLAVITTIDNNLNNFNITFESGLNKTIASPTIETIDSPFDLNRRYIKGYDNVVYLVTDFSQNEFDNRSFELNVFDKNKKLNGYSLVIGKNNSFIYGYEYKDNIRQSNKVKLTYSYYQKTLQIINEARKYGELAMKAQANAIIVKEKYKNKICKDSVTVDFMDNNEYKAICKEDEKNAEIKTRIDSKLAQIAQLNQAKRKQQNEQRLIQAREVEAMAAQRRAAAAEKANSQAAWDGVSRSIQNINNNMQMQQLNNNLMMYNFMPKRHDVYLH